MSQPTSAKAKTRSQTYRCFSIKTKSFFYAEVAEIGDLFGILTIGATVSNDRLICNSGQYTAEMYKK